MSYEEVVEKFRLDDICPEIDNELHGMFVDLIGEDFELGIFPEPSPNDEDFFVVTIELSCEEASIEPDDLKKIRASVEERLSYNLGEDWEEAQKHFHGIQIYFNGEIQ